MVFKLYLLGVSLEFGKRGFGSRFHTLDHLALEAVTLPTCYSLRSMGLKSMWPPGTYACSLGHGMGNQNSEFFFVVVVQMI